MTSRLKGEVAWDFQGEAGLGLSGRNQKFNHYNLVVTITTWFLPERNVTVLTIIVTFLASSGYRGTSLIRNSPIP